MPSMLLLIPLIEILGLLAFAYSSGVLGNQEVRYLPIVLAAALVIWLAKKNSATLTIQQVMAASIVISLVFVGCFQILGLVLPGLAKDVDVFSIENLVRLSTIAAIAVVGHLGLFAATRYLHR